MEASTAPYMDLQDKQYVLWGRGVYWRRGVYFFKGPLWVTLITGGALIRGVAHIGTFTVAR